MANLVPRDTLFRDLFDVRRNFDQAFNRFLSWPSAQEDRTLEADFSPAVESFPEGVDKDKISAEYRNGMLEITAPIANAALPKRVEIKSLPTSRAASA